MSSSFTVNNGLEKPAAGDQEGQWGGTLNTNFDIIDRVLSGVGSVALSGTTHTLTTSDGSLSDGQFKVINFTGALGANNTITISPNDQDKLYFIINATTDSGSSGPYSIIISQGSGANVTIPNGGFDIVIADGAGSGAAVTSLLSKKITTGQLTTTGNLLIPNAGTIGSAGDPDAISISSGGVVDFTQVPTFPNDTIETNDIQDNAVTLAKMAGLARGKIIVGDSSGNPSALALGSNGEVLKSDGSDLVFGSVSASVALDDIGTGDAASTLATSAGNITIDAQGSDTDIILKGTDGSSDITGIKIDMSESAQVQLPNDSQALAFGADQDVTVTHNHNVGLTLNSKDLSGVASVNTTSTGTRNYILNSSFDVAQRGQTINATTPISGANNSESYCLDQWIIVSDGNDIIDVAQSTTAPTGSTHSISLSIETANKKAGVLQWLEASQCQNLIGKTVTLSFQAKSSDAAVDDFRAVVLSWDGTADQPDKTIISSFGSEGSNPTYNTNVTAENTSANLNLSTSFQKFSITCDIDTSGAKNVGVYIFSNTTTGLSTGENIFISQVQLEVGSTATEYVHEDYSMTWLKCARYFRGWVETSDDSASEGPIANGHNMSGSGARIHLNNPVPFRATPTIDQSSTFVVSNGTGDITGFTSIDTVGNGQNGLYFVVTYSSSIPNGGQVIIFLKEGQGGIARWFVSCELGV